MKVIKEALLGKVSRLCKHGADTIQRFNTKSCLQWVGEAEQWEEWALTPEHLLQSPGDSFCCEFGEQKPR